MEENLGEAKSKSIIIYQFLFLKINTDEIKSKGIVGKQEDAQLLWSQLPATH